MCAWVPPAQYSEVKLIMKSFQSVFPNAYVLGGPKYPGIYLTGYKEAGRVPDISRFKKAEDDKFIMDDLSEWSSTNITPEGITKLLVLYPDELADFVKNASVVTDDHPYTEFPLWRSYFDPTYRWTLDAEVLMNIYGQKTDPCAR
jgi:hypothetical protein